MATTRRKKLQRHKSELFIIDNRMFTKAQPKRRPAGRTHLIPAENRVKPGWISRHPFSQSVQNTPGNSIQQNREQFGGSLKWAGFRPRNATTPLIFEGRQPVKRFGTRAAE
jgi:hypothetical protein